MKTKVDVSNNLREFFSNGFENAYDHNMSQIIQKFVEESKTLYTKMLEDTRGNVVNDSNFDELLKFASENFSDKQKVYNLKYDSFHIQPLDYSTNNIDIGIEPIPPGRDSIKHIYKVDGNIKYQKRIGGVLFDLLKRYKAYEDFEPEELKSKMTSNMVDIDKDNITVPMSYCIPMSEKYEKSDPSPIYKPGIINVYTHLDKDDIYKIFTDIIVYKISSTEESINMLDFSNFREFFRSLLSAIIFELNKSGIISTILNDEMCEILVKNIVCRSTFGSLSKFYDNMATNGVRGYILDEFRRIIKTSKTSETWLNQVMGSAKNPVDVIFGSRGMDHVYNFTVVDILSKKMYDKVKTPEEGIFEFLISNSFTYIIASGSLCIGEGDCVTGMNNFIDELPEDFYIKYAYIEKVCKEYYERDELLKSCLISAMYGAFMIKHLYDLRNRVNNVTTYSQKEYDYFNGAMSAGMELIFSNLATIDKIVKNYIAHNKFNKDLEITCSEPISSQYDPDGLKDIVNPNGMFDHLKNVICRILTMPTVLKVCRNSSNLRNYFYKMEDGLRKNPTMGDERSIENWPFRNIFKKDTENTITNFIGKESHIGGNVENFCNELIVDTEMGVESENEDLISDVCRRSLILNDLKYKNTSEENLKLAESTLEKVAEIITK